MLGGYGAVDLPRGQSEVTMEEEEDEKDNDCHIMSDLERLVVWVPGKQSQLVDLLSNDTFDPPDRPDRHEGEPGLSYQGNNSGPIYNARTPLLFHVSFIYVVDDEWESVHQCQDEHGPSDPAVEYLKFLVGNTSQGTNHVRL